MSNSSTPEAPAQRHVVAIAMAPEMSLLEAAAVYEVFARQTPASCYSVKTCGSASSVVGGWLQASADEGYGGLSSADTVVVPACADENRNQPTELVDAIAASHANGARVVSICTGAFVLAAAGILDGRRATTHWRHTSRLAQEYPAVKVDPGVLYVDEGSVLTSAGKGAGIDLCLYLVRKDFGPRIANDLARNLVLPPHRDGGQAQFIAPLEVTDDDDIMTRLRVWATSSLEEPLTVEDMARFAHMSPRQLHRRFRATTGAAPLQWLLSQRVFEAQNLLETTDLSIERIASHTGMGTAASLRRHFSKHVGVPPDTYRRTFQAQPAELGSAASHDMPKLPAA